MPTFPIPLLPWWVRWLAVVIVTGFIFYVSIVTVPPETPVDTFQPEFVALAQWRHFVAYGTLAYTLAYALETRDRSRWTRAFIVIFVVALYGIGIEIWQYFLPYRHFDVNDILANAIGAPLVLPWYLLRPYFTLLPFREWIDRINASLRRTKL